MGWGGGKRSAEKIENRQNLIRMRNYQILSLIHNLLSRRDREKMERMIQNNPRRRDGWVCKLIFQFHRDLCVQGFTGPCADNPSQRTPGVHETHTAKEELAQVSKGNRKKEGKKKKTCKTWGPSSDPALSLGCPGHRKLLLHKVLKTGKIRGPVTPRPSGRRFH